jgi:thiamine-monophosphate kinase
VPEFALIDRLARVVDAQGKGVVLGIGDDAAVLELSPGERLVAATDTLNEGVHFLPAADPERLGHKALAVNLSDLAAMGATPRWALLNLSLPSGDERWVEAFARGFGRLARAHGLALVGGDTCAGARSVTVTALGVHADSGPLRRSGASPGDLVMVSGALGGAAAALAERLAGRVPPQALANLLDLPEPRVALGQRLRGIATACIDLSDGLVADLEHLCRASGLGAEIDVGRIPAPPQLATVPEAERWAMQTTGGEDYELCFTVPEQRLADVRVIAAELDLELVAIGRMVEGDGVRLSGPDGTRFEPATPGWEHFRDTGRAGE